MHGLAQKQFLAQWSKCAFSVEAVVLGEEELANLQVLRSWKAASEAAILEHAQQEELCGVNLGVHVRQRNTWALMSSN